MKRIHNILILRFSLALGVAAALAVSTAAARADAWDKKTTVNFQRPWKFRDMCCSRENM
jgi:hypothetical protein